MKKIISLLLVLAMVLAAAPAVFAAGETREDPIPAVIPGTITAELAADSDGVWYSWTCPNDGTITFTVSQATNAVNTTLHVYDLTPYTGENAELVKPELHQDIPAGQVTMAQYSAVGGDELLIYIENKGDDSGNKLADTLSLSCTYQRGQIDLDKAGLTHTVDAGAKQAFSTWKMIGKQVTIQGSGSKFRVLYNGRYLFPDADNKVTFEGAQTSEVGGAKHTIENRGTENLTFTWTVTDIVAEGNVGPGSSASEPMPITVPGTYTAQLPAVANKDGKVGYFFSWTAPENGILKMDVNGIFDASEFMFYEFHITNGNSTWDSGYASPMGQKHSQYQVSKGDEIIIFVESQGDYDSTTNYKKDDVKIAFNFVLNGLVKAEDGSYDYYVNGAIDTEFVGLVDNAFGTWYVAEGKIQFGFNGLITFEGKTYDIHGGRVNTDKTGLVKRDGAWYYVAEGVVDAAYTGLAKSGTFTYYVKDGTLNFKLTDVVEVEGVKYFVKYGNVATGYTGLVKGSDGVWRYVAEGVFDATYTGTAKGNDGVTFYYVQNGLIDFKFSGTIVENGTEFTVKNGVVIA